MKINKSNTNTPILSKEGKLFGKIDIFIILFAVIIIITGIFIFRVLTAKSTYITVQMFASGGEWWWNNPDPPYWLTDPVRKGAIEYDSAGNKLVEVLEAQKFEAGEKKMLWVKARIRVDFLPKSKQYLFRREPLQIGSLLYIAPDNVRIYSNVMSIEGVSEMEERRQKIITLKNYGTFPWMADAINVGLKMLDDDGNVIAEVVDKQVTQAEMTTTDYLGNTHAQTDPYRKDVTLKIRMTTLFSKGRDYFSFFQPLKIGFSLWIPFQTLNYEGNITAIE